MIAWLRSLRLETLFPLTLGSWLAYVMDMMMVMMLLDEDRMTIDETTTWSWERSDTIRGTCHVRSVNQCRRRRLQIVQSRMRRGHKRKQGAQKNMLFLPMLNIRLMRFILIITAPSSCSLLVLSTSHQALAIHTFRELYGVPYLHLYHLFKVPSTLCGWDRPSRWMDRLMVLVKVRSLS